MPRLTLPDGSIKEFPTPVTVAQVAASIGAGLARAALAGKIGGRLVDLDTLIEGDTPIEIITPSTPEGLEILRHSTSHLMAQAVKELYPTAQVTIGPAVADGFYYDFDYERPFTPEDLTAIEARMEKLVAEDLPIVRQVMGRDAAIERFRAMGEAYKVEIIQEIPADQELSLYGQGGFVDLCRGPHAPGTGRLKVFKLTRVAGAYWRGDSGNKMLQRIYGTAFPDKKGLTAYLTLLEEAARRDHRKLGREMDLFSIQDEAGGGLVLWHPMGARVRQTIENYWRETHQAAGYEFLFTPHMANLNLWRTSGHVDFYRESMFSP
ncbi:MAG: TGS domain-containing protein, partial [Magnetococcales bacterium]|nr:TGS domain-containing protein [Magnetococcales bacterium]